MTQPDSSSNQPVNPSRRDRLKPLELIGFAVVLSVFAGLVILMATREIALAGIFAGSAFIVTVMVVALVGLGGKPSAEDEEARKDLQHPDDVWH